MKGEECVHLEVTVTTAASPNAPKPSGLKQGAGMAESVSMVDTSMAEQLIDLF